MKDARSRNQEENTKLQEDFTQVCVWPGTTLGEENDPQAFVEWMEEQFNVRVQFLECIWTAPDPGDQKGETGGRCDLFFAVHRDSVVKFAIPRLSFGIRWIEDVLSEPNRIHPIYPERVFGYRSWKA